MDQWSYATSERMTGLAGGFVVPDGGGQGGLEAAAVVSLVADEDLAGPAVQVALPRMPRRTCRSSAFVPARRVADGQAVQRAHEVEAQLPE